jgi:glutamate/tyrosine decarboxylase-like PLP-dependent enzyme
LPLWFSLATHGAGRYRSAIADNVRLAKEIAAEIERRPSLKLVREPELSIVVFERVGWELADYEKWSKELLDNQVALVLPSSLRGKPHTRFAIVNPLTTFELLTEILDSMEK